MPARWSRIWFGATALCVVAGVVISVVTAAQSSTGHFGTAPERAGNVFAFFTVQSNLIVGATTLLLAWRLGRRSVAFATFRLIGVVAIVVTGVVYHVALARILTLDGWPLAADQRLHTVVPIMAVIGWLAYGPRGLCSARVVRLSVLFPIAWALFTFVGGAVIHWYPYPFIDVDRLGYTKTILNCLWVAPLWLALAGGATLVDRGLTQRSGRLADAA